MNTFRSESIKVCLGFTFVLGVISVYAGIWSLHVSPKANTLLVSSIDPSIWFICAAHLAGFLFTWKLHERFPHFSAWILCLVEAISVFAILLSYPDPNHVFYFIVPTLFSVILLDRKEALVFNGVLLGAGFLVEYSQNKDWVMLRETLIPVCILLALTVLIEIILGQFNYSLAWYLQRYQIALVNEQKIRESETKLEVLVENLKEYKKYLTDTNVSLMQARKEAEEARQVKQNFVQNVSHELRTPLNLIIGFSETMVNAPQSYGEVNWTPDLHGDIECIYQNSQHLKALIDDILDMASLENKKYEIEISTVNLNAILREMILITESAYRSKGLSLEMDLSPQIEMVHGDAVRLKQVVLNLLSNALKYTSQGGVKISSSIQGPMAQVSVEDTGKGIPAEDIDKVFDAFFQVDKSSNREDYGTGLGLSISKQLIELHGGSMAITSVLGKGTTVFFSVPIFVP